MASINTFQPIQEGTGTPSPENIRPILPAVSVVNSRNIAHIVGYSAVSVNSPTGIRYLKNSYGTTISTTSPERSVTITQTSYLEPQLNSYANGYFNIIDDNLKLNERYNVSFTVDIIENPRNAELSNMTLYAPSGSGYYGTPIVDGNRITFRSFIYTQSPNFPNRHGIDVRSCGMSMTISDICITSVSETDYSYEPYQTLDIYGGYLDIVNSKIVEEWSIISKPWSEWTFQANQTNTTRKSGDYPAEVYSSNQYNNYRSKCNIAPYKYKWSEEDSPHFYHSDNLRTYIWLPKDYDDTVNVQVLGALVNPITYILSPTQLAQAMEQLGIKLSSTLIDARRKILLNSPHIETTSGSMANFSTDIKAPLKECKIYFSPVQEGSNDPSPDNIRPITGWIGVNAEHSGKNLYDISSYPFSIGKWIHGYTGVSGSSASFKCTMDFIPLIGLDGKTITLNKKPGGSNPGIAFYSNDSTNNFISGVKNESIPSDIQSMTVTVPDGTKYMRFTVPADATDIQIELGNVATEYENYNGTTFSIAFPSEAGTVYCGYVDLINGELVVTYGYRKIVGNEDWIISSGISGYCAYRPTVTEITSAPSDYIQPICDKLKGVAKWATGLYEVTINSGGNLYFGAPEELSTKAAVNAWIQEIGGLDIVFPLNTPITYQLTPQQIKTLIGQNNIQSNTGDVEIKYWTH